MIKIRLQWSQTSKRARLVIYYNDKNIRLSHYLYDVYSRKFTDSKLRLYIYIFNYHCGRKRFQFN